ncbi:hypothetical protein CEXT_52841 [Caerostris extrusa]|uniref:Uncharacterized protein n=1 Tax=Caerostris extrusa TaxID=172846 RepID=A0AAV4UJZ5_CAEEX|nr:hypothetical protein CEXT_52841 [Caerostris extrusa]
MSCDLCVGPRFPAFESWGPDLSRVSPNRCATSWRIRDIWWAAMEKMELQPVIFGKVFPSKWKLVVRSLLFCRHERVLTCRAPPLELSRHSSQLCIGSITVPELALLQSYMAGRVEGKHEEKRSL